LLQVQMINEPFKQWERHKGYESISGFGACINTRKKGTWLEAMLCGDIFLFFKWYYSSSNNEGSGK
jgi:hypothetical protein